MTADTSSPVRPQEPILRFRDPYHPGNLQVPPPSIPTLVALPQQQGYAPGIYANAAVGGRQFAERQPASSSSTAASGTGNSNPNNNPNNNYDPAKSDAAFTAPLADVAAPQLQHHRGAADASNVVVGLVPSREAVAAAAAVAAAKAEEQEVVAFPSSWTRGKLIGAGAFGQVRRGLGGIVAPQRNQHGCL